MLRLLTSQSLAHIDITEARLASTLVKLLLASSIGWRVALFLLRLVVEAGLEGFHLVVAVTHFEVAQVALWAVNAFIAVELSVIVVLNFPLPSYLNSRTYVMLIKLHLRFKQRRRIRTHISRLRPLLLLLGNDVAEWPCGNVPCFGRRLLRCLRYHAITIVGSWEVWVLQTVWWLIKEPSSVGFVIIRCIISVVRPKLWNISIVLLHFYVYWRLVAAYKTRKSKMVLQLWQVLSFPQKLQHLRRGVIWLLIGVRRPLFTFDLMTAQLILVTLILRLNRILNKRFLSSW